MTSAWATCLGLALERAGSGGRLDMQTAGAAVLAAISLGHPGRARDDARPTEH